MQYLTNLAVNKRVKNKVHFILDVEGYRKKRGYFKTFGLTSIGESKADREKVVLEPMSPQEEGLFIQPCRMILTFKLIAKEKSLSVKLLFQ